MRKGWDRIMNKKTIISIVGAVLIIGGLVTGFILYQKGIIFPKTTQSQQITSPRARITYRGQNNVTALQILERRYRIETSGTGENAFVTSINGVRSDSTKNYWSFSINDEPATVGAGSYVTNNHDNIVWELKDL